eukprot:scaffold27240_cov64-Phaeocystis_antarctica.AAC.6
MPPLSLGLSRTGRPIAEGLLDLAEDLVRVALDDALAKRLQALEPGHALVEPFFGHLGVAGELGAAIERHEQLVLLLRAELWWQHLVEDDERRGRVHLGCLEDTLHQRLARRHLFVLHLLNFADLLYDCIVARTLKEGLVEHALHRARCRLKVLQSLLGIGLEQLPQKGGGYRQVDRSVRPSSVVKRLVESLTQRHRVRRSSELLQVAESNVVVGVGLPERRAKAQVVEHDTKRPQVVGHARRVLRQLRSVDLALVVHGSQQHPRHLGRAVAGARGLVAKGLADLAEDVEVDDLPLVAVADGVEQLEVGVDAVLAV